MSNNFVYHKPKIRIINNTQSAKKITKHGEIALMCPKCFHIVETEMWYHVTMPDVMTKINNFSIDNEYYGECCNCGEDVHFIQLDINMGQIISILNNKGYYTAFCCEGHIEPNEDNKMEFITPYIYFYFWDNTKILETNPLPDSWYITSVCEKAKNFIIYDIIDKKIPKSFKNDDEYNEWIDWVRNNWNQKKSLEDIYNWVINLPDKSKSVKRRHQHVITTLADNILRINSDAFIEAYNESIADD